MKCRQRNSDVLLFTHLYKNPGSTVLNVLEVLKAPTRDSNDRGM